MTQPTPVVGFIAYNDKELTSPLAGYVLHSARRRAYSSMLLR